MPVLSARHFVSSKCQTLCSYNFLAYTVETKSGKTVYGMIAEENAASLSIKRPDGMAETVRRRDVETLTGTGISLMPDGLQAAISKEQMADLIAFLLR